MQERLDGMVCSALAMELLPTLLLPLSRMIRDVAAMGPPMRA